jgi:hypothetical protein
MPRQLIKSARSAGVIRAPCDAIKGRAAAKYYLGVIPYLTPYVAPVVGSAPELPHQRGGPNHQQTSPISLIRPRRSCPPLEFCSGARRSQAANWRPQPQKARKLTEPMESSNGGSITARYLHRSWQS